MGEVIDIRQWERERFERIMRRALASLPESVVDKLIRRLAPLIGQN